MSSLKFIQKEKASPSCIARISCYGSPTARGEEDIKPVQKLQVLKNDRSTVNLDIQQLEDDILELQSMGSRSLVSPRSHDGSLSSRSECSLDCVSFDNTPLPPRTDLLTDSILYSDPELSQNKDYWSYKPPKARASRAQSKYVAQCSNGTYHNIEDVVFQVQFKMGFRYFQCGPTGPYDFYPGDMVIVTGERGEDLGVVVELLDMTSYIANKVRAGNHSMDEEEYKLRTIVRLASMYERSVLAAKFHDEQMAGHFCAEASQHLFRLPMQIVGAEYQFDRGKLFVYYTANCRVDFRELIKHVFNTFKTCIWFKKVNRNNVFEPRPYATQALRTGGF
eukprot:gene22502-28630_t